MYASHCHMNQLLKLVESCYLSNPEAFEGRLAPIFSTAIRPGIGVATDDGFSSVQESLHSHRSQLFQEAYWQFAKSENGSCKMDFSAEQWLASFVST